MALANPRAPLDPSLVNITGRKFDLLLGVSTVGGGDGTYDTTDIAPSLWKTSFDSINLDARSYRLVSAWVKSLYGGTIRALIYDYARPYPLNYPTGFGGMTKAGGGAFTGAATLTSATIDTLTVGGLPTAFEFEPGDLIGITYANGSRHLHEILEAATGTAGGAATVTVAPQVRDGWAAGDAVKLDMPPAKFVMQVDAIDEDFQGEFGRFHFEGIQTLEGNV